MPTSMPIAAASMPAAGAGLGLGVGIGAGGGVGDVDLGIVPPSLSLQASSLLYASHTGGSR